MDGIPKPGETITLARGPFAGSHASIRAIVGDRVMVELPLLGALRELPISFAEAGLEFRPRYRPFAELLAEFDARYRRAAPLRYAALQAGVGRAAVGAALAPYIAAGALRAAPADFYALYGWKNGFSAQPRGWPDEFAANVWHEEIPLNDGDHLLCIAAVAGELQQWHGCFEQARAERALHYWKPGFLPFLSQQRYGMVVIDTYGHWGGRAGQIVSFDYTCGNGYAVRHENLNKWLETQLALLERGLLFQPPNHYTEQVEQEINGYYTRPFLRELPLEIAGQPGARGSYGKD